MSVHQVEATKWQLQEAKQRFSEVVRRAHDEGPQIVTRHGQDVAVIIDMDEYRRLKGTEPDFKEFLLSARTGPTTWRSRDARISREKWTSAGERRLHSRHQCHLRGAQAARQRAGERVGERLPGPTLYLSVMSVGEIRWGIEQVRERDLQQALTIERWLDGLSRSFQGRIIPITEAIAEEWGRMRKQRPFPVADALIAATAKVHGWSVVTRNVKDFADTGVTVINPFDWSA